jgi:hypothetical protein
MALKLYYLILLGHILNHTIPILVSDNIFSMFCTKVKIDASVFYLGYPIFMMLLQCY